MKTKTISNIGKKISVKLSHLSKKLPFNIFLVSRLFPCNPTFCMKNTQILDVGILIPSNHVVSTTFIFMTALVQTKHFKNLWSAKLSKFISSNILRVSKGICCSSLPCNSLKNQVETKNKVRCMEL